MSHAVTANRLVDGRVVFRTLDGSWSGSIRNAAVADSEAAAAPALSEAQADADNQIVVDPYVIEVDLTGPLFAPDPPARGDPGLRPDGRLRPGARFSRPPSNGCALQV